ncbi:amiloride-sensitive sodium channel subunit delta-like [Macrobrachium rosenbergii]|uniref:amiloride-sensitive sodium channel subunit delta-like n=1 Tax=Macrobrachium rosenbergii TaxID=79674 RepID=UPI0034D4D142
MLSKEESDFNDLTDLFIPTEEEKANYSISPKEFIYSCKFDGYPCDDSYFKKWPSDEMGSCYSFNSPLDGYSEPYLASGVGPMHGLDITLNVRTGMAILSKEVGVRVSIHSPEVLPVPLEEGFNVGPGTSSIRLTRTSYVHLGHPHGNCSSGYRNGAPFTEYSRPIIFF